MYQFKEELNYRVFFWFDKLLIKNMNWALLPKASKAIFPVIGCHCNKHGIAFPGERTIAILSGRTDKKVREGIRGLEDFPGFRVSDYITSRGRRAKEYFIKIPSTDENGRKFPFHKLVLECGNWRELKPTAQALYPVMRCFGFFDIHWYVDVDDIDSEVNDFEEVYRNRKYDYCTADPDVLAQFAGISKKSIKSALDDLARNFLIEPSGRYYDDTPLFKVYLQPFRIYTREFLNKKIIKSYQHEM